MTKFFILTAILAHMNEMNHLNWRRRAMLDVEKVRDFLLQTIETSRRLIEPSSAEEVFCMTMDIFAI